MNGSLSPAATAAVEASSTQGETNVARLMRALTRRTDSSATKVLGRLSIEAGTMCSWLDEFAPTAAISTEALLASQRQLGAAYLTPSTTGGVVLGLIGGVDDELAGLPGSLRRQFTIYATDIKDVARSLRDACRMEMLALLTESPVATVDWPAPPLEVRVPYSILLEATLDRAEGVSRTKKESNISTSSLMAAMNALHMTADWRDFYDAVGYSAVLLGGETPRSSPEPGDRRVHVLGPASVLTYTCSDALAAVLWTAATFAMTNDGPPAITPELLLLAQVANPASRIGALIEERVPPGIRATSLFLRWTETAALTRAAVVAASSLCAPRVVSSTQRFDDTTPGIVATAAATYLLERHSDALTDELARCLERSADVLDPQLADTAHRIIALLSAQGSGAPWSGDLAALESQLTTWVEDSDGPPPAALVGAVAAFASPDGGVAACAPGANVLAALTADDGSPSRATARALYEAKVALQQSQSDSSRAQEWAKRAGERWSGIATRLADHGEWSDAAAAITIGARVTARTANDGLGHTRWTPRHPALELVEADIETHPGQLAFVTASDGIVFAHRTTGGRWNGTLRALGVADLDGWRAEWHASLASRKPSSALLRTLPSLLGVDVSDLQPGRMDLVVDARAATVPLGQAIFAATAGSVHPIVHVAGALGTTSSEAPPLRNPNSTMCLVAEPPVAGGALRFAGVEVATLKQRLQPASVLAGSRASRSWVQRAISARPRAPTPDILHFVGHGTFDKLPDGTAAASMILADGQRLTPSDIARVSSRVRVALCSACDLGILDQGDGTPHPPWPLAAINAGVGHVVAAAWPVADAATVLLMTRVHEEWTGAVDLHSALVAACGWLRTASRSDLESYVERLSGENVAELAERVAVRSQTNPDAPFSDSSYWAPFALYSP
ncbi:MAG: hypothetical protein QOK28_3891 [Actinomycetota bacterium]